MYTVVITISVAGFAQIMWLPDSAKEIDMNRNNDIGQTMTIAISTMIATSCM